MLGDLHSQNHGFEKALRGFRIFLQHFSTGNQNTLGNSQRLVQVHDHRETFVDKPDRIFSREWRGMDDASLQSDGAQRGAADGAEDNIAVRINVVSLQKYSDRKSE